MTAGDDRTGGSPAGRRSGRRRDPLERIPVTGGRSRPDPPAREPGTARSGPSRPAGLDRIRPRGQGAATRPRGPEPLDPDMLGEDPDPLGRLSLYSSPDQPTPALGTFIVECSACRRETPVRAAELIRAGIPSIHVPLVKRHPSFMRCPACGRRTWVRVRWRL